MPTAVVSDVHSNLAALEAVLEDIEKRRIKEILFLGDAVGYGPDPNECVSLLRKHARVLLAGNHDWAVLGQTDIAYFNPLARAAVAWTDTVLTKANRKALASWPLTELALGGEALLVHASPEDPPAWHYLITPKDGERALRFFSERICMVGHSHRPFITEKPPEGEFNAYEDRVDFREGARYVVNAGSVGQPRDRDPRACYAVLRDGGLSFVRVPYDIERTQEGMRKAGLPAPLAERLSYGM
jgi:diadenosine tetraphosphatase ApaH/serine/threonine PP2A family protein phosphatase